MGNQKSTKTPTTPGQKSSRPQSVKKQRQQPQQQQQQQQQHPQQQQQRQNTHHHSSHHHPGQPTPQQMHYAPSYGPVTGPVAAGPVPQQQLQHHQNHQTQLYVDPKADANKEKKDKKKKERDPILMPAAVANKKLKKIHFWAELLDAKYSCCCMFRFGLESLIGIIPIIGDFAGVVAALILISCIRKHFDLPAFIVTQMFINIAIDFAVGLVPILGDIVDMLFKANMRNYSLVKDYVEKRQREAAAMQLEAGMANEYIPPQHPHTAASYIPHVPLQPGAKTTVAKAALKKFVQQK